MFYRSFWAAKAGHTNDVLVISYSWQSHAKLEISNLSSVNRSFSSRPFKARRRVLKLWDQLLLHRCCPSHRSWHRYHIVLQKRAVPRCYLFCRTYGRNGTCKLHPASRVSQLEYMSDKTGYPLTLDFSYFVNRRQRCSARFY